MYEAVNAIRDLLRADADLVAVLTGGIYSRDETGRKGIDKVNTPDAFDADGLLKPCALIRSRSTIAPFGGITGTDAATGYLTGALVSIEVWLYDDTTSETISTAAQMCVVLLNMATLEGIGTLRYGGGIDDYDPNMMHAPIIRLDFNLMTLIGGC